jgi:hypothetical protein
MICAQGVWTPRLGRRQASTPHRGVPVIALAVAGGLDWARDICQRVQQTVAWRV